MNKVARTLLSAPFLVLVLLNYSVQAKTIVIATSSVVLTNTPFWVGIERKFFADAGVNVQYVVMRSDLAVRGLMTEDVDYNQSASSVFRAAVAGAPLSTVLGIYNRTFFDLVVMPDIKSINDLRGKTIGISRHGASTEYALRFGLQANNINPDKDVKLLAVGADAGRISALQAGIVAAAVLQTPSNLIAHKLGARTLLPLGDYMETLFSGLGTSQKKINSNREEVRSVIRALLKSLDYMANNPAETKAIIQKHLRGVDTATVNHIYGVVVKNATKSGIPSKKALENSLLGTPFEGKPLDFDKFVDFSIAREAR